MRDKLKNSLIITLLLSCVLMSGCNKSAASVANEKLKNMKVINEDEILDLDLYFAKDNGDIGKEENFINIDEIIARTLVNRLIEGPATQDVSLGPVLPKETRLLSLSIKEGTAVINLSKEAVREMDENTEKSSIKAIVSTLCQLDSIDKIKIISENNEIETLGGNYSIIDAIGVNDVLKKIDNKK